MTPPGVGSACAPPGQGLSSLGPTLSALDADESRCDGRAAAGRYCLPPVPRKPGVASLGHTLAAQRADEARHIVRAGRLEQDSTRLLELARNHLRGHPALSLRRLRPGDELPGPGRVPGADPAEREERRGGSRPSTGPLAGQARSAASGGPGYSFLPGPMPAPELGFAVLSMNILAGCLGRSKTHGYCRDEHLRWESRREKLISGLRRARPDILLLQEVQGTLNGNKHDHFGDLCSCLSDCGLTAGAYARICGVDGREIGQKQRGKPHIGNAIFYRTDVWRQLDHGRVPFAQLLGQQCGGCAVQHEHYTEGKQVAAWVRLLHATTGRTVVAVSVHLSCNYDNPDTQVAQASSMLQQLEVRVLREGDALVIGGDFNSVPGSGVYQLFSTGELPARHPDACPKRSDVPRLCSADGFRTGLRLASAYATLGGGAEPEVTVMCGNPSDSEGPGFGSTLDYLWYSRGALEPGPGTALPLPTAAEARREGGGLPNSEIPSDHAPIGAAFGFLPRAGDRRSAPGEAETSPRPVNSAGYAGHA